MRRVCVFCGSSGGARPDYLEAASTLGTALAAAGIGLVYGGTRVGLMGAVADAVLAGGGDAIGVITTALADAGIGHGALSTLEVVEDMHARKGRMAALSDGFVALPGGFGTWEELCEVLTWSQLGLHRKPAVLFDVAGYWDLFLAFADHATAEGFVKPHHRATVRVGRSAVEVIEQLSVPVPAPVPKWVDPLTESG